MDVEERNLAAGVPKGYSGPLEKLTGDKTEALARGIATMGSLIMKIPIGTYDAIVTTTNKVINRPFGLNDAPTFAQLGPDEDSIYKSTINDLDAAIKRSSEQEAVYYGEEISPYFFGEKKDFNKGLSLMVNKAIESLPTSLALMYSMATNPMAANAAGVSAFSADKKMQLDKAVPEMPEDQKVMWSTLSGATEQALENFGLSKLAPLLRSTLKKAGKEAMEKEAKQIFNETVGKVSKKYLGVFAEEVGSEGLNQFMQNVYANVSGEDPNRKLSDGVLDAMLVAGISAGGLTGPAYLAYIAVTRKSKKQAQEINEMRNAIMEDMRNEEIAHEIKDKLNEKLKDLNEQEADLAAQENEAVSNLSSEAQTELDALIKKKKRNRVYTGR